MGNRAPRPPAIGRWLLRLARLGPRHADCDADLIELFSSRAAERGVWRARARYLVDAVSILWHSRVRAVDSERADRPRWWRPDHMLNDIRFALRLFRCQAGVMTLAVVGLALAIGVNTAAFSFVSAFALRPLGVADPAGTVHVLQRFGQNGTVYDWAYGDYLQFRERSRLFTAEASVPTSVRFVRADGEVTPATVRVRFVSGGFFDTFGGRASFGRVLTPSDGAPAATPVVVLSHAYWKSRFGGDPRVVGSTVSLAGTAVTIVGVADRPFTGPFSDPPAAWLPLRSAETLYPHLGPFHPASPALVSVVAHVTAPESLARAEAEAAVVLTGITLVATETGAPRPSGVRLDPAASSFGRSSDLVTITATVMGIVGLVLLLACTNVANLLLAGATTRRQEIAARLALGASRGRIVRQLLTESVLLGLVAGALGLLVAAWMLPALAALVQVPAGADVSPDWRVLAFAVLASVLAGVAAGLAPARYGARGDVVASLKGTGGSPGGAPRSGRLRSTFVGIQAAASLVLLVLAMLFGRVVLRVATEDAGIDPAKFMSARQDFGRDDASGARSREFLASAVERARTVPGVEAAGVALFAPFQSSIMPVQASHEGRTATVHENRTSAGYFETLGLRVVRGRLYTEDEVRRQAPVAVISSGLARNLWGTSDAIGGIVDDSGRPSRAGMPDLSKARIVGVVEDAVQSWRHPDVGWVYLPLQRADTGGPALLILRTAGDASEQARPIEDAIAAIDPANRLTWTMAVDSLQRQISPARVAATLTSLLGVLALGLAVVGIFGVTAFVAGQRLAEISVRMALGATGRDILALLLTQGLRPVAIGLAVGLLVALGAGQVLAFLFYGISPRDPIAMGTAVLLLASAAIGAVLIPVRRAARVDPARVLRQS